VTLGRLVFAWLPVAAAFLLASAWKQGGWALGREEAVWRALEALAITLFGSLWFDSLGHGGWWLLFLMIGLIVSLARMPDPSDRRAVAVRAIRDVVRYVLAGAILAWRLG
jgi:hypothetical protein